MIIDEDDFKPISEEVIFVPQGSRTKPVRLNITNDDVSEPVEDLQIRIPSVIPVGDNITIEPVPTINVTIIDDDTRKSVVWVCTRCSARSYHSVLIFCKMYYFHKFYDRGQTHENVFLKSNVSRFKMAAIKLFWAMSDLRRLLLVRDYN